MPTKKYKAILGLISVLGLYPLQAEACSGIGIDPRLSAICRFQEVNTTPQTILSLALTHRSLTRVGFKDGIQLFPPNPALNLQITARPTLSFSENINGGLPNGILGVAGMNFSPNQDQIKQSGWLVGFELGTYGTYSLGRGSYLDFQAAATAQRATDHDLTINTFTARGCGHLHLGRWRYLDICGGRRTVEKELATERLTEANLGFSQLWSTNNLSFRLSGGVSLSLSQSGEHQTGFTVESEFIGFDGRNGGIQFELTNGSTPTAGHGYSTRVWLGGNIRDRPFQAFAEFRLAYESEILNVDRVDRATQLGLAYVPRPDWIISLGVTRVESSISYYSTTSPFLSIQYQAVTF